MKIFIHRVRVSSFNTQQSLLSSISQYIMETISSLDAQFRYLSRLFGQIIRLW